MQREQDMTIKEDMEAKSQQQNEIKSDEDQKSEEQHNSGLKEKKLSNISNADQNTNSSEHKLLQINNKDPETIFNLQQEIYSSPLSPTVVYIALDTRTENSKMTKDQIEQARVECYLQTTLDHFNIVQGYEHFENDNELMMTLELLPEADYLQEKLENPPRPIKNELKIKSYLFDILQGLNYIHKEGYVHLDLKPANFYAFKHENEQVRRVKIGDLGYMKKLDKAGTVTLKDSCGTFGYKAPEACDIWSLGITLYVMSVAYMPHHMKGYKYGQGDIPFRPQDWKKRSPQLKEIIIKMLQFDPALRPTAEDCLRDSFLSEVSITTPNKQKTLPNKLSIIREESKQE